MIIIVVIPRCSSKVLTRKQHGRRLKVWALSRVSFDQSESLRLLQGKCWHCAVLAICSVSYEILPPPRPLHLVHTAQWLLAWSESVRCNNILLAWPPPHWMCYSKRRAGQRWYECFSWLLKMKCMTDFKKSGSMSGVGTRGWYVTLYTWLSSSGIPSLAGRWVKGWRARCVRRPLDLKDLLSLLTLLYTHTSAAAFRDLQAFTYNQAESLPNFIPPFTTFTGSVVATNHRFLPRILCLERTDKTD